MTRCGGWQNPREGTALGAEAAEEPRVAPCGGLVQEVCVLLQLHVTSSRPGNKVTYGVFSSLCPGPNLRIPVLAGYD